MKRMYLALAATSALALASCNKLGSLSADYFTVTPTPLEAISGQVPATINGTFPEKYMKKKAQVTVTPVLRYEGGEAVGQSASFQGEKVEDNNMVINYKVGGNYTMKSNFTYTPEMLQSDLYLTFDAKVGKKRVSIPDVKVGYGIVATSALLGNTLTTTQAATAPDAFERVIQQKQEANIKFLIGQANLRTSELQSVSMKDLVAVLKEINDNQEERALNAIELSAYASPDGSYTVNERLAERRQNVSADYLRKELQKIKMSANVNTKFTAEDWEGFQELISQSNLQDKEVILRVLSMYQDPEEREQQIRNMSSIYTDIATGILPELRRARLTVTYEIIGRSDDQIVEQFASDPTKLSVEELVYGAGTIIEDRAQQKAWYQKIAQLYPNDYRAYSNLAQIAYTEGDYTTARQYLQRAKAISNTAPEVNANMALLSLMDGDTNAAEQYLAMGSGANTFNEILGNLNIAKGNYTQAAANLAGVNTNSAALAQILAKDYASARNTLANIKNTDGTTAYLKAILAARTSDTGTLATSLREAIAIEPALALRAAKDIEFAKYASTIQSLLK